MDLGGSVGLDLGGSAIAQYLADLGGAGLAKRWACKALDLLYISVYYMGRTA